MKKKRILVGVPTQEMGRASVFYDYLDLLQCPEGCELLTTRAHGQSPARNRNIIIDQAIRTECDYIFFVDDDCLVPPDTLVKLYNYDVDCITGLYCMRNYPHRPIIFKRALDDGRCEWYQIDNDTHGLIEIAATGMGALLVKIDVFKRIQEIGHKYWVTLGELEADHWCDDLSFFKRVREAEFKIYCDTRAPVGHIAKATVWPNRLNDKWHITYDTDGPGRVSFPLPDVVTSSSYTPGMKAPNDVRPTWRNGIIQIHISRACDLSCTGCTQGSNLAGKPNMMTPEQFETAVQSMLGYQGVIGIFGGNPTIHPQFDEICAIAAKYIPKEQLGLWTNNLNGKGPLCRETFNPEYSNINVHGSVEAFNEIRDTWPEAHPKGLTQSRHSPPFVALKDMEDMTDAERWALIFDCDINKYWSAMIGTFRGGIRAWFCELAGAQSMLHQNEENYPDTGLPVTPGWWQLPIPNFEHQIHKHCMECGVPLRGMGSLDNGNVEYVSKTHLDIYRLKKSTGKLVKVVKNRAELNGIVTRATDYIENGSAILVNV